MRLFRVLPIVLALLVTLAVPSASAAGALDRIVEKGELRVGMSGDQPPLNAKSKSGDLIGFEVDLVNALATSMGVKAKLVVKPFSELLPALQAGEVDMVVSGVAITPERNTKVAFVGPYTVTGKSILTTSTALAAADESGDLNMENVTLTALAGSTSQKFVEVVIPKATLKTTQNYDEAVKLVKSGEADALIADIEACQLTLMRYPNEGLATLEGPLTLEPIGIALPPDEPLLMNLVENYLAALEIQGLLELLHRKWYEDGSWLIQLP
jgi:polar amino acid transport system substrate-binding protein